MPWMSGYEGHFAVAVDAAHAVRVCSEVRAAIRTVLQLPNDA